MKQKEFKSWLEKKYLDSPTTVSNRLSNCKNIEKFYGDLDEVYEKDECNLIINELTYSTEDERENKQQRHLIPINGNIRTGSATLKQAIRLYVEFKEDENLTINDNTLVYDNKHDTLIETIKKFTYNKKIHSDIFNLQNELTNFLNENFNSFSWETEYRISDKFKDSIDIIGISDKHDYKHVIELDAHRADQVSKKFVSRIALLVDKNICYTAICYPGTENMSIKETLKYFNYCQTLVNNLPKEKTFRGLILKK